MDSSNVGTHGLCVRKSPRAQFHNYSGGNYFVTICTKNKTHYFGYISDNTMHLTPIGQYCEIQLSELSKHYPYAEIPLSVVMPNHIHAIICIREPENTTISSAKKRTHEPCVPTIRTLLSIVVGGLKRSVTMYARKRDISFAWQSRYHDHIIRGALDGNKIADYINHNVARWDTDCFNDG